MASLHGATPAGIRLDMAQKAQHGGEKKPALTRQTLAERLAFSGVRLSEKELTDLVNYLELLQKWNKVMNLVGPYPWPELVDNLILDSFHLARFISTLPLPARPETWDFGAGAGLPGIPLRMVWQAGTYTMVDSREKRVTFLRTVLASLPLPGTRAEAARVENFMAKAAPANVLISRAFMPWEKLLPLVQDHLTGTEESPAIALFMTLEPAPSKLPAPWRLIGQSEYSIPAGRRYLWALSPSSAALPG